jgi:glycosyltransferase involved in cell wall biosynthesis
MHSNPTVSVVMPTHNRAALLGRAIRSVLAQTHTNWELIIVDDASRDNTAAVVAGFADARITYVRNEVALGPAGARNTGIAAAAATDYLSFLDDDDEWLPRKLELQLELFRTGAPDLVAVGCGRIDVDEKTTAVRLPDYRGHVFEHLLARRARGYGAQLIMVRRRKDEPELLFDRELQPLEDADYSMRQALRGTFDFVPEALVRVFRDDGGQHVWNSEAAIQGYRALARKYATELSTRPWISGYYRVCVASDLARLGRLSECRASLRSAVAGNPQRARVCLWLLASLVGAFGVKVCSRLFPIPPPQPGRRRLFVVIEQITGTIMTTWPGVMVLDALVTYTQVGAENVAALIAM